MDYAGAVIGTLLAAAALSWTWLGITQVIALSAIPGVAVLILLILLPVPVSTAGVQPTTAHAYEPLSWGRVPRPLQRYLQVLALFCFAKASEAFIILRGHELGMQTVTLLLLWAWLAALQTLTAYLGAPLADKMSKRSLTLFNWGSLAVGYAGLAMVDSQTALWVAVSVYGLLSGISEGVERSLVSELAPEGGKGTAFGWYYMVTGVAAIPSGLIFGLLWSLAGPGMAFGLAALVALLSAAWLKLRTL